MADREPSSELPSVDHLMDRLCRAGWAVECREITRNGRPVWLVGARKGRGGIQATGATLAAALSYAVRRAALVDAQDRERRGVGWLTVTEPLDGPSPARDGSRRGPASDGDGATWLRIYQGPSAN